MRFHLHDLYQSQTLEKLRITQPSPDIGIKYILVCTQGESSDEAAVLYLHMRIQGRFVQEAVKAIVDRGAEFKRCIRESLHFISKEQKSFNHSFAWGCWLRGLSMHV